MDSNRTIQFTGTETSQENRSFPALDFNYVKIDERNFQDLLVFASEFSKLINYYGLNDKVDGDWSHFLSDETVILANIIDANPAQIEIKFKNNLQKAILFKRIEKKLFYLKKCFQEIHDLAYSFQHWLSRLREVEVFSGQELGIKNEIANAISSKLSTALQIYKNQVHLINSFSQEAAFNFDFTVFPKLWGVNEPSTVAEEESNTNKSASIEVFAEVFDQVEACFQAFYETLLYLKNKASEYLAESLKSDTHYPEVALFLAFLKLFRLAQGDINKLTKKHLDFYYSEVLKQTEKEAVPDKVYLKFSTYPNTPVAEVAADTAFYAGDDEAGNAIVYKADNRLLVNKAEVERLNAIYIDKDILNIKGKEKTWFKNVFSSEIPISCLTRKVDDNVQRKSYPSFGENQEGKGAHERTMQDARLGFAIASPILFLKEGFREITISMTFLESSFRNLMEKIADLALVENSTEDELFIKSFMEAFEIEITASEGWLKIKDYIIVRNPDASTLAISFDLAVSDAAIVELNPAIHGGKIDSNTPLIRFSLSSNSFIYTYSFLNALILEEVKIDTKVSGVKDLTVYNNIGQVSTDNPFLPFGPMPATGSYMLIGNDEIFNKALEALKVNIEWFDLPKSSNGFWGHYKGYGLKADNTSFEATISVLDNGRWKPQPQEQQRVKLFRTEGKLHASPQPKLPLSTETSIENIEIQKIQLSSDYDKIGETPNYTSTSQRGFIKLELSNPDFGFAHAVYPSVLSKVALNNSKSGMLQFRGKKEEEQPNPPYTPQIRALSLDYTASSVISLRDRSGRLEASNRRGAIFHIHPFGENLVFPDNSMQQTYLLPGYAFEGALMIGFKNINPPQTIAILFEMFDEFTISSEEDPPEIEWSFLADNKWHLLKPSKILRDETNNFIKTGIIEIDIPFEINRNNTIMDKSLFWLKASVLKNIDVTSKMVSICTQAVVATLSAGYNAEGNHLKRPLPAFSVKQSVENIEGIESIVQPLPSFNGRAKEDKKTFYTRVAERLKHKSRAIMAWDYERLILEKLPSVYKVACLPNMTSESLDAPGSVLIVVSPFETPEIKADEPMVSSELLYQIKSFITSYISPFVRLEVRNPAYERIKIICAVKFTDGYNYGYFLQKLNEELRRYLSRATEEGCARLNLGGKVNTSDILSFMRTLPYVDFITRFSMIQAARNFSGDWILIDTAREGDAKAFLQATKPWSVLVPAQEHQILVLNEKFEERSLQAGIDSLELGNDFIIK